MSRWSDIVDLLKEIDGYDDEGYPAKQIVEKKGIYANKKSVRSAEFYQAASIGYGLEVMFIIRSNDFDEEEKLRHEEKEYDIVRTYDKGEFIELICMNGTLRKFR